MSSKPIPPATSSVPMVTPAGRPRPLNQDIKSSATVVSAGGGVGSASSMGIITSGAEGVALSTPDPVAEKIGGVGTGLTVATGLADGLAVGLIVGRGVGVGVARPTPPIPAEAVLRAAQVTLPGLEGFRQEPLEHMRPAAQSALD